MPLVIGYRQLITKRLALLSYFYISLPDDRKEDKDNDGDVVYYSFCVCVCG